MVLPALFSVLSHPVKGENSILAAFGLEKLKLRRPAFGAGDKGLRSAFLLDKNSSMPDVYFYHLSSSPLEGILPTLLAKSLEASWRVLVRTSDLNRADWIDQKLWLIGDASFLPHGVIGSEHDQLQPVLIASGSEPAEDRDCLVVVDGADIEPGEISSLTRASVIFDGNDASALDKAREQWQSLSKAGFDAHYWAQEDGSWVQKYSTAAAG